VNICTGANVHGQYDYIVRLCPPFISPEMLLAQSFKSIEDIVSYLKLHHRGEIEKTPADWSSSSTSVQRGVPSPAPSIRHPFVELFQSPEVNRFASLKRIASALSDGEIQRKFDQHGKAAPNRGLYREYFVGHTGKTTSGASTNRREEQLAIAVWLAYRESGFELPDGTILFPVEYQLPLKSHRDEANVGLGKVDLFCVESGGDPWITELKIQNGRLDTPLKAVLEALAYCATLAPDMRFLSRESNDRKQTLLHIASPMPPNLLVLAPAEYWDVCNLEEGRNSWREALQDLGRRIEETLKIKVRFVRMENCRWEMTATGMPRVIESPVFKWAIDPA
jgi:hypothetical protein